MMIIDSDRTEQPFNRKQQPSVERAGETPGVELSRFTDTMVERANNIIQWSNGVEGGLVDAPVAVKNILLEVSAESTDYEAASMAIERLFEDARAILCVELTFLRTLTVGLERRGRPTDERKLLGTGMLESAMVATDHVIWPQFQALSALFGRVQGLSEAGNLDAPEHIGHRQAFFDELERIIQGFVDGFVGNSSLIAEVKRNVAHLQTEFKEKDALDERL